VFNIICGPRNRYSLSPIIRTAVPCVIQKLIMTIIFVVSFRSNHGPKRRLITASHRFRVYVFLGISNQSVDISCTLLFGICLLITSYCTGMSERSVFEMKYRRRGLIKNIFILIMVGRTIVRVNKIKLGKLQFLHNNWPATFARPNILWHKETPNFNRT